ncbi:MAG: orotate phosphoribosyltransferase [Candidatus Helarchaeota archaeon]|nr:orotate phosphoribosyltransferase [Candidatus Helarchaeota archaeon]
MTFPEWKKDLARYVIKRDGLLFGEFVLKSKRKSPYFFNLAKLINDGEGLQKVAKSFARTINEIGLDTFDYIHGPAYKGIPLAGAIAILIHQNYNINKRWGYDRKESKSHGVADEAWLVGNINNEDRIILVDDVITTGLTKINNIEKLEKHSKKSNLEFIGIIIFLDRQETDTEGNNPITYLEEQGLKVRSILKIREIVDYLKDELLEAERYWIFKEYFERYGT